MKKVYIIAGEKSGDNIGGKLIREIKNSEQKFSLKGVGGSKMIESGLEESLFDIKEINLMGFLEVLPHAFRLISLINKTVQDIIKYKPDYLITIDSPGFNFRVVEKLRKLNFKTNYIHYVAPSVWAYKPERAKKTSNLYDKLVCIIPWEKPYFDKVNLNNQFVGHPLFEDLKLINEEDKKNLRQKYRVSDNQKIISILPGSRLGEIKKHKDILIELIKKIKNEFGDVKFFILPTQENIGFARLCFNNLGDISFISEDSEKQKILQISDIACVKSGTVSLEVAALGVPYFTFYKANAISIWFIKRIVNIKYANLINISANKEIIPELIQEKFTSNNAFEICKELMSNEIAKKIQMAEIGAELDKFKLENSSKNAFKFIFEE